MRLFASVTTSFRRRTTFATWIGFLAVFALVAAPSASAVVAMNSGASGVQAAECNDSSRRECYGGSDSAYCGVDLFDPANDGDVSNAKCLFHCNANSVIAIVVIAYDDDAKATGAAECSTLAPCPPTKPMCTGAKQNTAAKTGECTGHTIENWESGFFLYCEDLGAVTGEVCRDLGEFVEAAGEVCWQISDDDTEAPAVFIAT
jgi:hypothetical protein